MKTKTVAFLSDFGTADPFVSAMKGIVLTKVPSINILDITHEIPAQDIHSASFYLMAAMPYMPPKTLFVCVVDPTVGTDRGILWARTKNYQFVAPDNGLISWAEQNEKIEEVRLINNSELFMKNVSSTFHGRDIMAPVAGLIAKGLSETKLGPIVSEYKKNPFPQPVKAGNHVTGEVIAIAHFGNAITNIKREMFNPSSVFSISDRMIHGIKATYASVPQGESLALIGSFGFLEFSVRNGNFAKSFDIKVGTEVETLGSIDE